jgi:uncharacterized membrane protein YfbV (UPF0208 family)
LWNNIKIFNTPNHFLEAFPDSMTSIIPGRRASIEGTWFARIPMSPVAAATFTWTTSAEVKIAFAIFCAQLRVNVRRYNGRTW